MNPSQDLFSFLSDPLVAVGVSFVLILCFVLGFVKGLLRVLGGAASLLAGLVVFWQTTNGKNVLARWFVEDPTAWLNFALSLAAAYAVYSVVRLLLGLILRPMVGPAEPHKGRQVVSGLLGAGLGALLLWGGGALLHRLDAQLFFESERHQQEASWVNRLYSGVQESWLGSIQERLDLTHASRSIDLVKLLSVMQFAGKDEAPDHSFQTLFQNPKVQNLLEDPKVQLALEQGDLPALFKMDRLREVLRDPQLRAQLDSLKWSAFLTPKDEEKQPR